MRELVFENKHGYLTTRYSLSLSEMSPSTMCSAAVIEPCGESYVLYLGPVSRLSKFAKGRAVVRRGHAESNWPEFRGMKCLEVVEYPSEQLWSI